MGLTMLRSYLDKLYGRSSSWAKVRKAFIELNPECAVCGTKKNLEVHHIIPYQIDKSKELEYSNLITLCGNRCHFLFGHLCDWKSWNVYVVDDCREFSSKIKNRPYKMNFGSIENKKSIFQKIFSWK